MNRTKRDEWRERVRHWKTSGQTAVEFAAREGVQAKTLQHWSWQLAREARGAVPKRELSRADFVEVISPRVAQALAAPRVLPTARAFEVTLPNGARVTVPQAFNSTAMAELVRLVGAL